MSRAAKIFLGSSVTFMGVTIWGVHWMQQRESDNMYLGVIRDEERVRNRELEKARVAAAAAGAAGAATPGVAPVNAVQPAAVVDEDCVTCVVSPPPQLLEAQSKEQRAADRAARLAEYEQQKGLAASLGKSQNRPVAERVV